jgi:hypothetical protein
LLRVGNSRLSGSTRDVAVVDLVQSLDAAGESGVLHLSSGAHKARLYFRDGHVVDADLGTMRGEEAIYRAFLWYDALFDLELRPVTNTDVIVCSTQTIVRKGMQRVEAWLGSSEPAAAQAQTPENLEVVTPTMSQAAAPVQARSAAAPAEAPSVVSPAAVEALSVPTNVDQAAEVPRAVATTSRSSSAPWTREVDAGWEDLEENDESAAAGLPPKTRKMKGFVVVTVAVAAMVLLTAGLRSSQTWKPWRASVSHGSSEAPAVAAAKGAEVPAISSENTQLGGPVAAVAAPVAPAALSDPTPSQIAIPSEEHQARDMTPGKPEPVTGRETAAAVAKEAPIDIVKLTAGSLSPLVKDAQRALLQGQTERALALANKAVADRPTDADAWLTLAAAQKAAGDLAAARETYMSCVLRAQTENMNHCRILAGKPQTSDTRALPSPDAHGATPLEATPQAAAPEEVAQSPSMAPPSAPRMGIHAPESVPATSKTSDQAPPSPPASR